MMAGSPPIVAVDAIWHLNSVWRIERWVKGLADGELVSCVHEGHPRRAGYPLGASVETTWRDHYRVLRGLSAVGHDQRSCEQGLIDRVNSWILRVHGQQLLGDSHLDSRTR